MQMALGAYMGGCCIEMFSLHGQWYAAAPQVSVPSGRLTIQPLTAEWVQPTAELLTESFITGRNGFGPYRWALHVEMHALQAQLNNCGACACIAGRIRRGC